MKSILMHIETKSPGIIISPIPIMLNPTPLLRISNFMGDSKLLATVIITSEANTNVTSYAIRQMKIITI
jgi:hypothetical protein